MSTDDKKNLGNENRLARAKSAALLTVLKGKDVTKLTKKETDELLCAVCLLLGIADKNGIIS